MKLNQSKLEIENLFIAKKCELKSQNFLVQKEISNLLPY
jgi:hypothetical protein